MWKWDRPLGPWPRYKSTRWIPRKWLIHSRPRSRPNPHPSIPIPAPNLLEPRHLPLVFPPNSSHNWGKHRKKNKSNGIHNTHWSKLECGWMFRWDVGETFSVGKKMLNSRERQALKCKRHCVSCFIFAVKLTLFCFWSCVIIGGRGLKIGNTFPCKKPYQELKLFVCFTCQLGKYGPAIERTLTPPPPRKSAIRRLSWVDYSSRFSPGWVIV